MLAKQTEVKVGTLQAVQGCVGVFEVQRSPLVDSLTPLYVCCLVLCLLIEPWGCW